ncbi:type II secretion system F family protein [Corynebacterium sp. HMSC074A01]|uniref:type II secretion system F family protein n=1 Tax=Corynebacterium sp. HMSC074A01 TaxID=1715030 RepID=UPI0008A36777|nr:type II secretion system F family protein [Corynebacterium sp. HMSC074A01]OHF39898.1 hypothetical protein HMPREF2550_01470 [Corynebacterium sp. HMSC074A01]
MNPLVFLAAAAVLHAPAPAGRLGADADQPRQRGWRSARVQAWAWSGVSVVAFGLIVAERITVVIAVALAGATAIDTVLRRRQQRMKARGARVTADFLGHVVSNLDAGAPLERACVTAAERLPDDAPPQLQRDIHRINRRLRAGQSVGTAVESEQPELQRLVALWQLAQRRGVPVANLLRTARDELDRAQRHRAATTAALAGPRTTATVLAALPLAGIGMGAAMGANPIGLLTSGGLGGILLVVGTALVCAGVWLSRLIIERAAQ